MFSVQIALKFEKMAVVAGQEEICRVGEGATYESHTHGQARSVSHPDNLLSSGRIQARRSGLAYSLECI